ncbi:MAG: amino acid ABC transporter substrate-binding protein [Eubacteriales bacterium]|nr:amino acid ABC transporter substrate-binding protein [Eubacteriales bacterium]
MKRRTIALLLAAVCAMTMALAGCGSKKEATTTKEELKDWDYIQDKGVLTIGLDDTFAPMGFRDKDDKLVGFDIDLAKAVGKELDVKVKFQPIDWTAKEAEMKSKRIDCIWNGMSATPDRAKAMSLSKCYLENKILIMTLDKSLNIKDSSELKNIKIGTQGDSSALEAIQADKNYDKFKDNVKEYKTYDEAILDLKAGRIKCIAIDEVYAIYNNKNKTKLYTSDYNFGADLYAIGFRKEDTETTEKVNEALKKVIDDGTAKKISKKWFGTNLVIYKDYK